MRFYLGMVFALTLSAQTVKLPEPVSVLVDRDAQGNIWTVISTRRADLPTSDGALQRSFGSGTCTYQGVRNNISIVPCTDLYIQKYSPDGQSLLAATYLGSVFDEVARVLQVDLDGSVWVALHAQLTDTFPNFAYVPRNLMVLVRLSSDLTKIEQRQQYELNGSIVDAIFAEDGIFVAMNGSAIRISPGDLSVQWRSDLDSTVSALSRLSAGDLIAATARMNRPPAIYKLRASDGAEVFAKDLDGVISNVRSIAALPGNSFVTGGSRSTLTGFYQRFNADGDAVEPPQTIGTEVSRLSATADGLIGIWGKSLVGLATSIDAPRRCRNDGGQYFYAELPYANGSPRLITYVGEPTRSNLVALIDGDPVFQLLESLSVDSRPKLVENTPSCLDGEVQSYAVTIGRASLSFNNELSNRHNVAPGELLTIFGAGFAKSMRTFPPELLGELPMEVEATRFLVDGVAVGIVEVGPNSATLAIPFGVAGRDNVDVVLEQKGIAVASIRLQTMSSAPYLLTERDRDGDRIGVYLNGHLSTESNVVYPGDEVSVYMVGAGALNQEVDARTVLQRDPLPLAGTEVRAFVEGAGYQAVTYAGAVKGQLPGLMQVNVTIAADLKYFGKLTLSIFVNGRKASASFTMKQR